MLRMFVTIFFVGFVFRMLPRLAWRPPMWVGWMLWIARRFPRMIRIVVWWSLWFSHEKSPRK